MTTEQKIVEKLSNLDGCFFIDDSWSPAIRERKKQEWIASHTSNILFEGDRIFNQSFLEFATRLPNTDLQIVILTAPKTVLEQRYRDRGSNQSETFLKGRETKYDKIQSNFELISYIKEFPNATHEDQQRVLTFLDAQLVHKIL